MLARGYQGKPVCRRFPPLTGGQSVQSGSILVWMVPTFFRIRLTDWCGEHQPAGNS